MNPEPDKKEFEIGFDSQEPELMMIQVPVGEYARNKKDGMALFYGKMREAEAIGGKIIKEKRMRAAQGGILSPAPMPMGRPN